jgi:hypothetical protein
MAFCYFCNFFAVQKVGHAVLSTSHLIQATLHLTLKLVARDKLEFCFEGTEAWGFGANLTSKTTNISDGPYTAVLLVTVNTKLFKGHNFKKAPLHDAKKIGF